MYKTSEIQTLILDQTDIKTTVKKGTGSMKQYLIFSPMFQKGKYPEFPFDWRIKFISQFPEVGDYFSSSTGSQILIYVGHIEQDEAIIFNRERKPKPISERAVRQWGSKNSQMRLDKTSARYAKKRSRPGGDNMVKYW